VVNDLESEGKMTIKEIVRTAFEQARLVSFKRGAAEYSGHVRFYDCFGFKLSEDVGGFPPYLYIDITDMRFEDQLEEEDTVEDISKQRWRYDPDKGWIYHDVEGLLNPLCVKAYGTHEQMVVMTAAPDMLDVLIRVQKSLVKLNEWFSANGRVIDLCGDDILANVLDIDEVIMKASVG